MLVRRNKMSDKEMIDYYKNRFQIMLMENNELDKQLELYKTLSTLKDDLINQQNKVIKALQRRLEFRDRRNSNR